MSLRAQRITVNCWCWNKFVEKCCRHGKPRKGSFSCARQVRFRSVLDQFKTLIRTNIRTNRMTSSLTHCACAAFVLKVRTFFFSWSHYFWAADSSEERHVIRGEKHTHGGRTPADGRCHLDVFHICFIGWMWQREGQAESCGHQTTARLGRVDWWRRIGRGADLGSHPTRSMVTQWDQKKDGSGNTENPPFSSGSWYWLYTPITLDLFPAHRPEPGPVWKWNPQKIRSFLIMTELCRSPLSLISHSICERIAERSHII